MSANVPHYKLVMSMAQAQLHVEAVNFSLNECETPKIYFQPKKREITSWINETVSIVVKRTKCSTVVTIRNGNKSLRLQPETFDSLCDLQQSVLLLVSFLEGNFAF